MALGERGPWPRSRVRRDHLPGRDDEGRIVSGRRAVRQECDVLKPGPDAMTPVESSPIDGPAGDPVPVMHLFQGDTRRLHDPFHGGCVAKCGRGIQVQGLDQNAAAMRGEPGSDEGLSIVNREQSRLNPDAPGQEVLTERPNPGLALIGGHQVGQFLPCPYQVEPLLRIRHNRRGGRERNRSSRTEAPHGLQYQSAGNGLERLSPIVVEGVHMHRVGPSLDGSACCFGNSYRSARRCGMNRVAIEGGLQEDGRRHGQSIYCWRAEDGLPANDWQISRAIMLAPAQIYASFEGATAS